jgi:hypothetical protein
MLAKSTIPLIPTVFDVRLRQRGGSSAADGLFPGWGIAITGTRSI